MFITLINYGYIHFTKNFILNLKANKISKDSFHLYIHCLDKESYNKLIDIEFLDEEHQCYFTPILFEFKNTSSQKKQDNNLSTRLELFGNYEYKKIVFRKLDCIKSNLDLLFKTLEEDVLIYIDMDIVLFKNPLNYVKDFFLRNNNINFLYQCDENNIECNAFISKGESCRVMCSGFFCINLKSFLSKDKDKLLECFLYNNNDLNKYLSDQDILFEKIKRNGFNHRSLSKTLFPNGYVLRCKKDIKTMNYYLFHFNYLVGNQKVDVMKELGVWKNFS